MTGPQHNDEDRILDLLAERLERNLDDTERAELDALLRAHPEWRRHDLDFAAASIHMALDPDGKGEDMPDAVKARVIGRVVGDATRPAPLQLAHDRRGTDSSFAEQTSTSVMNQRRGPGGGKPRARSLVTFMPWAAAAAALVVAIVGWLPRDDTSGATPSIAREQLAKDPNAVVIAWSTTEDPLGKTVKGDVIWSPSQQTGFMRFKDLAGNDPKVAQYQLWIFDAERDERYPVDGGVFDVNAQGETVVQIKPRVPVSKATLFAITLEKPGGVVVSTRERLVAIAKTT